jgi:hypothetical protein
MTRGGRIGARMKSRLAKPMRCSAKSGSGEAKTSMLRPRWEDAMRGVLRSKQVTEPDELTNHPILFHLLRPSS